MNVFKSAVQHTTNTGTSLLKLNQTSQTSAEKPITVDRVFPMWHRLCGNFRIP